MSSVKQIASRMIEELPDEMIPNVISYIAFVKSGNTDKMVKEIIEGNIPSNQGSETNTQVELETIRQKRLAFKGSMKGKIWMSDCFGDQLEELK